jgi:hypothetical protein
MWQSIKSGAWFTPARARVYPLTLLIAVVTIAAVWIALADNLVDRMGKPIGTDFSNVWAAGELVLEGQSPAARGRTQRVRRPRRAVLRLALSAAFFDGRSTPRASPLWVGAARLDGYDTRGVSCRAARDRAATRNGPARSRLSGGLPQSRSWTERLLTAALLGGALLLLDARPVAAGALIGLLAYKPQFGVLVPVVLVATGRWRVLAAATITLLAACAAATVLFGPAIWVAFAESTAFTKTIVLEAGGTGWEKIQSLFSAVRMWGGGIQAAYLAQGMLDILVASTLVWLWRARARFELKAAALPCACLLSTPYVLDYDLVVMAVSIAFFVRFALAHGLRDYEVSLLAFAWITPLIARGIAGASGVPLGFASVLALYALILRRAFVELAYSGALWRAPLRENPARLL